MESGNSASSSKTNLFLNVPSSVVSFKSALALLGSNINGETCIYNSLNPIPINIMPVGFSTLPSDITTLQSQISSLLSQYISGKLSIAYIQGSNSISLLRSDQNGLLSYVATIPISMIEGLQGLLTQTDTSISTINSTLNNVTIQTTAMQAIIDDADTRLDVLESNHNFYFNGDSLKYDKIQYGANNNVLVTYNNLGQLETRWSMINNNHLTDNSIAIAKITDLQTTLSSIQSAITAINAIPVITLSNITGILHTSKVNGLDAHLETLYASISNLALSDVNLNNSILNTNTTISNLITISGVTNLRRTLFSTTTPNVTVWNRIQTSDLLESDTAAHSSVLCKSSAGVLGYSKIDLANMISGLLSISNIDFNGSVDSVFMRDSIGYGFSKVNLATQTNGILPLNQLTSTNPGLSTHYLNSLGQWTTPAGSGASVADNSLALIKLNKTGVTNNQTIMHNGTDLVYRQIETTHILNFDINVRSAATPMPLNQFAQATNTINMGGFKILNIGFPTLNSDAASKIYVDNKVINVGNLSLGAIANSLLIYNGTTNIWRLLLASDIPSLLSSKISDLFTNSISAFGLPNTSFNVNTNRIINVSTPIALTDGVNKSYVDDIIFNIENYSIMALNNVTAGHTSAIVNLQNLHKNSGSNWFEDVANTDRKVTVLNTNISNTVGSTRLRFTNDNGTNTGSIIYSNNNIIQLQSSSGSVACEFALGSSIVSWINSSGALITSSDERLKNSIENKSYTHKSYLDRLNKVKVISYMYNHQDISEPINIGFSAQQLIDSGFEHLICGKHHREYICKSDTCFCKNNDREYLYLEQSRMIPYIVLAVQELTNKVDLLGAISDVNTESINQLFEAANIINNRSLSKTMSSKNLTIESNEVRINEINDIVNRQNIHITKQAQEINDLKLMNSNLTDTINKLITRINNIENKKISYSKK